MRRATGDAKVSKRAAVACDCLAIVLAAASLGLSQAAAQGSDEPIGFMEVARNPTDLELNLAYANQRIEAGDYKAAAATIERLLFLQPAWDEVRLLYASVLYKLGDVTAAQREVDLLQNRNLPAELRNDVDATARQINNSARKTRFSGRVSAGLGYDENAATLTTEDVGDGTATETIDQFSFVGRATFNLERDVSAISNRTVFATADLYTKQFEDEDLGGFGIGSFRAGMRGATGNYDWQANLSARAVSVQDEDFLTEIGIAASVLRELSPNTSVGLVLSYHDQDYEDVFEQAGIGEERSGERYDIAILGRHRFSPRVRGMARVDYREKTALSEEFEFNFWGGQLGVDAFFDRGIYVDADAVYRDYSYDGGFGTGVDNRNDTFLYTRAAAGIPVSQIAGVLQNSVRVPLLAEIAVYNIDRQSNVDVFEFNSTGAEARIIWRFGN